MTLKQALISESFYREPEAPNVIYINLSQIPNVEKLIEEVAKDSFKAGEGIQDDKAPDNFWQVNKERWLDK